jgi:hypothetical protein
MKGMEPESTSSLDDLLRPLDVDYQPPVSVQPSPCNGGIKYLDSFMHSPNPPQSAERDPDSHHVTDQVTTGQSTGGAIPKCRKSWHPTDINNDELSSLLASDLSNTKHISSDFSDSVDCGKSSLDSSKSKSHARQEPIGGKSFIDPTVLLRNEPSSSKHLQDLSQCNGSKPGCVADNTDNVGFSGAEINRDGNPWQHKHAKSGNPRQHEQAGSGNPKLVYQNFPAFPTQGLNLETPGVNNEHPGDLLPQQRGVINDDTSASNIKHKHCDSGVDVDL